MKAIVVLLLLTSSVGQCQGYWDHFKKNVPSYSSTFISGGFNGAMDVLQFKYERSVFPKPGEKGYGYWNPDTDTYTSIITDNWVTGQKSSSSPLEVNFNVTEGHVLFLVCDKPPVISSPGTTNGVQVELTFN